MSTVQLINQQFPIDRLLDIETKITNGEKVTSAELIEAIEQNYNRLLGDRLRTIMGAAVILPVGKRGRRSNFGARQDFAMHRVDQRYPALLRYEERKREAGIKSGVASLRGEPTPSARAYERLRQHMKRDFNFIGTWEALRNLYTKWKNGHLNSVDYPETDDLNEQIDHHFPPPDRS